ncbi:DUF58 domain-containing protein [Paenibacillus koleovorans]|uniref:DUF58 domain-containing protein n=1 Tax=Paenibacillus koleovorans TaxID=121608 RepID=UPI000FDA88E1|nr:DUF58 domain-containing protein [Paenibacillus koleovorans]
MGIHWFIFLAFLIAYLQGKLFKRWGLSKIAYHRQFSVKSCYAGEELEMVERIVNRKPLPLPWLRLEALFDASLAFVSQRQLEISGSETMQNHKSLFSLLPYGQVVRRHKIVARKRGCYRMETVSMTCGDMLGLHKTATKVQMGAELIVYPKPVPFEEIPLPSHSWQGDITVRRWIMEDPFMIQGVRDYRYGDTMNMINWKATARSSRLQVQQRDFTADHRLMIYVNFDVTETMWNAITDPELVERGIAYAASIAENAVSQGIPTGFGCNGSLIDAPKQPVRVAAQSGPTHLTDLFETMAKLIMVRSDSIGQFLEQDVNSGVSNMDIIVITAFVSDEMQGLIDRLRLQGNAVEIVPLTQEKAHDELSPANGQTDKEGMDTWAS